MLTNQIKSCITYSKFAAIVDCFYRHLWPQNMEAASTCTVDAGSECPAAALPAINPSPLFLKSTPSMSKVQVLVEYCAKSQVLSQSSKPDCEGCLNQTDSITGFITSCISYQRRLFPHRLRKSYLTLALISSLSTAR